jgi:hypothetical protein
MKAPGDGTWLDWDSLMETAKTVWTALCNTGHCKKDEGTWWWIRRTGDPARMMTRSGRVALMMALRRSLGEVMVKERDLGSLLPKTNIKGKEITKEAVKKAKDDNSCTYCLKKGHRWTRVQDSER